VREPTAGAIEANVAERVRTAMANARVSLARTAADRSDTFEGIRRLGLWSETVGS
jgi:hypothetical protein